MVPRTTTTREANMYEINERPHILMAKDTDQPGYRARALCLVDGYPAEVDIIVNRKHQEYNSFRIMVWCSVHCMWEPVYHLEPEEVGHMPPLVDDATLATMNRIADSLHATATMICRAARQRQDHVEAEAELVKRAALHEAQDREAEVLRSENQWVAPEPATPPMFTESKADYTAANHVIEENQ